MKELFNFFAKRTSKLTPNSLEEKAVRMKLVDDLTSYINEHEFDQQEACSNLVIACIQHHLMYRLTIIEVSSYIKNSHNILYVAAKLAFDFKLQDTATVVFLLKSIFLCDMSFERLLIGGIFGICNSHLFSDLENDFYSKTENVEAIKFFLDHTLKGKMQVCSFTPRFIDVPLVCCGFNTVVQVALITDHPDLLKLFLQYGAAVSGNIAKSGLHSVLERMRMFGESDSLKECLKLILRAVKKLYILPDCFREDTSALNGPKNFKEKFGDFIRKSMIPKSSCGIDPPTLQHLCKLRIRHELWKNYELPYGIESLKLPTLLKEYLNLDRD